MSENLLLNRIDELSDRKAIRFLEFYAERIFTGTETSPEEMINNIPEKFKKHHVFDFALNMSRSDSNKILHEDESIKISKVLLRGFAQDKSFAPSLEQSLNEYQDDKLMAGSILAMGVAISMIIVASTTTVKGKIGDFEIVKEKPNEKFIEALLKHFPKLSS